MSNLVKFGIVAAAITGLIVFGVKKVKAAINAFDVKVIKYGFPNIKNYVVNLPIQVKFTNPTPYTINIDNLYAEVYVYKGNSFQKVAQVNQQLSIASGESTPVIYAAISLVDIFGGNLLTTIQTLTSRSITLRTDVKAKYGLITIPASFTNTVDIYA